MKLGKEPGRELDKLVALIFGWKEWEFSNPGRDGQEAFRYKTLVPPEYDGSSLQHLNMIIPHYSTDIKEAMVAFDWLEKNNPWRERETESLALFKWEGKPTVGRIFSTLATRGWVLHRSPLVSGESYPHAISLAILESSKVIRKL